MSIAWMSRTSVAASLLGCAVVVVGGCANNASSCSPDCPAFTMCCDSAGGPSCFDIINDPANCGACGNVCPSGQCREARCVPGGPTDGGVLGGDSGGGGGDCRPACGGDARCCGTDCVATGGVPAGTDGRNDPTFSSCRFCGDICDPDRASACSSPAGAGAPRCMCGSRDQCASGEHCLLQAGAFTCVRTNGSDPNNCGGLGIQCGTGERCVSGVCQCGSGAACGENQACCGSACVDTQTDTANCGACGNACVAGETCSAGVCLCGTEMCERPMAGLLGATCGEICCEGACRPVDAANCGGCGTECTGEGNVCGVLGSLTPTPGAPMMPPSCGPQFELSIPPMIRSACGGGGLGLPDGGLGF